MAAVACGGNTKHHPGERTTGLRAARHNILRCLLQICKLKGKEQGGNWLNISKFPSVFLSSPTCSPNSLVSSTFLTQFPCIRDRQPTATWKNWGTLFLTCWQKAVIKDQEENTVPQKGKILLASVPTVEKSRNFSTEKPGKKKCRVVVSPRLLCTPLKGVPELLSSAPFHTEDMLTHFSLSATKWQGVNHDYKHWHQFPKYLVLVSLHWTCKHSGFL